MTLHLAGRYGHWEVCKILLAAGVDAGVVDDGGCRVGERVRFWVPFRRLFYAHLESGGLDH